jgi:hypothetical protein
MTCETATPCRTSRKSWRYGRIFDAFFQTFAELHCLFVFRESDVWRCGQRLWLVRDHGVEILRHDSLQAGAIAVGLRVQERGRKPDNDKKSQQAFHGSSSGCARLYPTGIA